MESETLVFGLAGFLLTVAAISTAGGDVIFEFNFNYQNETVGGEAIGIGLEDAEEFGSYDFVYYDNSADKLRVNTTALENTTGGTPSVYLNPNVTGVKNYIITAEVPSSYYDNCAGKLKYQQGLISQQIENGENVFENRRSGRGDFNIIWGSNLFDSQNCQDLLYDSNITEIQAEFPSDTETGARNLLSNFQNVSSGNYWFNFIFTGAASILAIWLFLLWLRGSA